jgi:F0F1-type ATP synthase membrane subunit b/b'
MPKITLKQIGIAIGAIYAVLIIAFIATRAETNRNAWETTFTIFNALAVFLLLYFGLKDFVAAALAKAATETAQTLVEARAATAEAAHFDVREEELKEQLNNEREQLKLSFNEEFLREEKAIMAQANTEARMSQDTIAKDFAAIVAEAKENIRRRLINDALTEAQKILQEKLDAKEQGKVFENCLTELAKK